MNPIALANLPVECWTDQRAVGGVGAHHDLKPVALGTQHAADPRAPGGDFGFETSGAEDRQHGAQHRIPDHACIGNEAHLDRALLVLHAVVQFLGVDYAVFPIHVFEVFDQACGDYLAWRQQGGLDDVLQALGADGIFLVG